MNTITNRQTICDTLMGAAKTDKNIIVTCSDSRGSGSMTAFADSFPEQFVELGIAEQNLVSVSAGMAACGKKVFAVSPACFLSTRSYEQAKVDVAYANTSVTLVGISGGISYGALGMTHHSLQDIAAFCALPNMRVYLPSDRFVAKAVIEEILADEKPTYIRVSRTPSEDIYDETVKFSDGIQQVYDGDDILIVACGEMVSRAKAAAELLKTEGISACVLDAYRVKPLNEKIVLNKAKKAKAVVIVEEHSPYGGLGSQVAQVVGEHCPKKIKCLSLPDGHIVSGAAQEVFAYYGLTGEGIAKTAMELLQ